MAQPAFGSLAKVDAVVQRIAHLPHHPQPVGAMASQDVGIDGQRGLEFGQLY